MNQAFWNIWYCTPLPHRTSPAPSIFLLWITALLLGKPRESGAAFPVGQKFKKWLVGLRLPLPNPLSSPPHPPPPGGRVSRSPSPKASLELSRGNQLPDKNQSKEKVAITHSSRQTSVWGCLRSWKLQHVTASRPRPWKSRFDLVWLSASLPRRMWLRMRAARLRALLTTPLPPQLHYSCKHTAVTSTECVGWALRTLPELPDGQGGLCSLPRPARGWWFHRACFVDPDLLLPCSSLLPPPSMNRPQPQPRARAWTILVWDSVWHRSVSTTDPSAKTLMSVRGGCPFMSLIKIIAQQKELTEREQNAG